MVKAAALAHRARQGAGGGVSTAGLPLAARVLRIGTEAVAAGCSGGDQATRPGFAMAGGIAI